MSKTKIILWGLVVVIILVALWMIFKPSPVTISVRIDVRDSDGQPLSDAKVMFDRDTKVIDSKGTARFQFKLMAGDTVEVSAKWKELTQTERIGISKEVVASKSLKKVFIFTRPRSLFAVRVEGKPGPGISIKLDNAPKGLAPVADSLLAGVHQVSASKPGYRPREFSFTLANDTGIVIELEREKKPPPAPGPVHYTVKMTSTPPGADIIIDQTPTGSKTPGEARLPAGQHLIQIQSAAADSTFSREIDLTKNMAISVNFHTEFGFLTLNSAPPGATINIDGVDRPEQTPAELRLNSGTHEVVVSGNGQRKAFTVVVRNRAHLVKTVSLTKCEDSYKLAKEHVKANDYAMVEDELTGCDDQAIGIDLYRGILYLRGFAAYNLAKYEDARSLLTRLTGQADPTNALGFYYLALANEKLNRFQDAIDAYKRVVEHIHAVPEKERQNILAECKYGTAVDLYSLSRLDDPDGEYLEAAIQNMKEYVNKYCKSAQGSKFRCDQASKKLEEWER